MSREQVRALLRALEDAGVKQAQNVVAGSLGVSKSLVSKWASGEEDPPEAQMEALAVLVAELVRVRDEIEKGGGALVRKEGGRVVYSVTGCNRWTSADFVPLSPEQLRALFPAGIGGRVEGTGGQEPEKEPEESTS